MKIEDLKKFREASNEDKVVVIMDALASEEKTEAVKLLTLWVAEIAKGK